MLPVFLLAVLGVLAPVHSHHVLCVFPVPSQSHNILGKGIVNALLAAGHKVTWGTPYPPKGETKNLRIIDLSATVAISSNLDMTDPKNRNAGMGLVKDFSRNISSMAIQQPALRTVLVEEQFDAVVTEWFFNDFDAGYAAVQQAPWILLSGTVAHPHLEELVDEVRSVPTHPQLILDYPMPMSLGQRLLNTMFYGLMTVGSWLDHPSNAAFYTSNFGPLAAARGTTLPPFTAALHNISVLLVNTHPSVAAPRSLPPNVIDVAGFHFDKTPPPLPKDLQDLLDSSTKGVVYFSLGSVVKSSAMPEKTRREILKILGELPYTVLWKFEKELKDVPKNVHVRPWMPQASILAHPNIKLFITHGGLLSTLEAAHFGVPLLAVPVFGDQPSNAARSVRAGLARSVPFSPDMAPQLKVEIHEILGNDRYHKRAKQVSALFRARPLPPAELIASYVQLAIDTKGAYHLRSPSKLYAWYERMMLDQLAVLLATLYVLYRIIRKMLCFVKNKLGKSKQKTS